MNSVFAAELAVGSGQFDLFRGAIAAAAFFSVVVSVYVLFYSREVAKRQDDKGGLLVFGLSVARAMKKLVLLNTVALVVLFGCYLVRFFFAVPQERIQPEFVFYADALTYYVGLFHIVFPALILFFTARKLKGEIEERKGSE